MNNLEQIFDKGLIKLELEHMFTYNDCSASNEQGDRTLLECHIHLTKKYCEMCQPILGVEELA